MAGNYLLLDLEIRNQRYTIGAIYGPNHDEQINMFESLKNECLELGNRQIILGGDFNATWDSSRVNSNIDVINMVDIPSRIRTNKIHEIAEELDLTEPYRFMYPTKKKYTFIPSSLNSMNRSRIDFFLLSLNLATQINSCEIPHSLTSTLFDHKQIFLNLGACKKKKNIIIKDSTLKDADLQFHVQAGIMETYLHHAEIPDNFNEVTKTNLLGNIGTIMSDLKSLCEIDLNMATNGRTELEELRSAGLRAGIRLIFDDMPELENLNKTCDDDIFFEALLLSIKNNVLSHQSTIFTIKNARKLRLVRLIANLKGNFLGNEREILHLERELSNIEETERKIELEHYKTFSILNSERITSSFMSLVKNKASDSSTNTVKTAKRNSRQLMK